jgi:putative transposase
MRVLLAKKENGVRKSRFSEEQIIGLLKEAEAARKVADLRREHGISEATLYRWKSKYSGMEVGDAKKLRALEDENQRLKHLVADQQLDNQALKAALGEKW